MNDQQLQEARRVARLIAGFLRNDLSPADRVALDDWLDAGDDNVQLFEKLTDEKNIRASLVWLDTIEKNKKPSFRRRSVVMVQRSVAAAVIITISVAAWWSWRSATSHVQPKNRFTQHVAADSIVPGAAKATLITPGRTIDLALVSNNMIRFDDNNQAVLHEDGLHYTHTHGSTEEHTLRTPNGGTYRLELPDGTRAWLNAASSVSYPVSFSGAKRNVSVTGEVYFEVASDHAHPFVVHTGDSTDITVTGTRFNVRGYLPSREVTLLEGSVTLRSHAQSLPLQPGQQAHLEDASWIKHNTTDEQAVTAWTHGEFYYTATPLQDIMDDIARWYNVSYHFEKPTDKKVTGRILRNSSLDEMLRMLRLACGITFTIDQRMIRIRS